MAAWHVAEAKVADAGANEPFHFVTDLVKHAANLAVQTLLQDDAQPGGPDRLQAREPGAFAIKKNSIEQLLAALRIPATIECDLVFLLHFVARMGEVLGEVAVARQEKQSFGLGVEPADIEKPTEFRRQQIINRVGRVWIVAGGNEAGRLVQDDGERFGSPNGFAADLDVIAVPDLRAEIGAWLAVDGDAAFRDELVAMPARAEPGGGEKTIEAHFS